MSGGQSARDLRADAKNLFDRKRADPLDLLLQRLPVDVLHHQVGCGGSLFDCVDADHVRVAHRRSGLGFAEESLSGRRVQSKFRTEDFNSYHPIELGIMGPQHHAHSPPADYVDHLVRPKPSQPAGHVARFEKVEHDLIRR